MLFIFLEKEKSEENWNENNLAGPHQRILEKQYGVQRTAKKIESNPVVSVCRMPDRQKKAEEKD
jgi:hypothetical protein